jgi:hypothetical protein
MLGDPFEQVFQRRGQRLTLALARCRPPGPQGGGHASLLDGGPAPGGRHIRSGGVLEGQVIVVTNFIVVRR